MNNNSKRLIKLLWQDNKWWLVFVAFLILLSSAGIIYNQVFIGKIIIGQFLASNQYTVKTFPYSKFYWTLFYSFLIFILSVLISFIQTRIMIKITYNTMSKLRIKMYQHLQKLPVSYFDQNKKGDILSNFTVDINTLKVFLNQTFPTLIRSVIIIVSSIIIMFNLNWLLTLFMIAMIMMIFVIDLLISKKSKKLFKSKQQSIGKLNSFTEEMLNDLKTIKIFNQQTKVINDFKSQNDNLYQYDSKSSMLSKIIWSTSFNLGNIGYAIVTLIGGIIVLNQGNWTFITLSVGTLISFTQFSKSFANPVSDIALNYSSFASALAGARRIFNLLDQPIEQDSGTISIQKVSLDKNNQIIDYIENDPNYELAWNNNDQLTLVKGQIVFDNVSFGYGDITILQDISFSVKPGQKVALVGHTGAGKTTIINLLARFYEITKGTITIDGIDIKNIEKDSLRKAISYVLQDSIIFTDTVKNNITYGETLTENQEEEIQNAAKISNLDIHIDKMKNKYETLIKNSGNTLSQGQKQLISIARANFKNAPILVLDEATSNIDTKTEFVVQNAMDKLIKNKTTLIIAHRLSTIKKCDLILVLNQGKILEKGTHLELLKNKQLYYELWTNNTVGLKEN
ncbi:ATP-binding cassette domain-containing protein [Mycoplasma sp. NEAQ87857]|uniref:ABC transporter ATP-binding protein n=1 Tax=Mycoplasma sp. NEAQ87857 TaxID=2683967 RepID=UPI0013173537|nr:ABC transporter ATP-binding protein [Mycoplasma sp. NEAQ87857]QGZ97611.1 ATP-binding cassette domain-containing protein [Mycoplasma sp. NEAQ87857]